MSTIVYLVRHGYSLANEKDLFLGHGDMALTEKGKLQAKVASDFLSSLKPDVIYSSDLLRAKDTATPTAEKLGIKVILDQRFRELDAGEWDFLPFREWVKKYPKEYKLWMTDLYNSRCVGGESIQELKDRISLAISDVVSKNDGKTIMIFSHANPIMVMGSLAKGDFKEEINKIMPPPNVSATKIIYDNGKFSLDFYGKADYLGDLVTRLPDAVE